MNYLKYKPYICPECQNKLFFKNNKICCINENHLFDIININKNIFIINFVNNRKYNNQYMQEKASLIYRNSLKWLFKTFKTNQKEFRKKLLENINFKKNQKILITGVGNGDDVIAINKIYKKLNLKYYVQDISVEMIKSTFSHIKKNKIRNCDFHVSNANKLPFQDNYFDHTFHFGGINLFPNLKKSINEMTRVTKNKGSVTFGDEGIIPSLRKTTYAKMLINNNSLWRKKTPIDKLPYIATNIKITWLLENCFYLINFIKDKKFPKINIDVIHKSPRGGTIRSRYLKQLSNNEKKIFKKFASKKKYEFN